MDINTKRPRPYWKIIVALILLILIAVGIWWYINSNNTVSNNSVNVTDQKSSVVAPQQKIIRIAAMGDMLAHDTIIANAKTDNGYVFDKYFSNIRSSYQDADVIFCNQEGLSSGEQYGISGYPSFNAPIEFASSLQSGAGCNLINLANNHMGDKGVTAINTTIDVWGSLKPLAVTGANRSAEDQEKVSYATINGIKIGFVAFADFNNNDSTPIYAVNIYQDEALVRRLVIEARANSDVVIVSMHWGVEDSNMVSSDQYSEANLLSSLGVDVIIGTGPHVLQKAETLDREDGGKTIVWYSLGNMLSSQLNIPELFGGIAKFDITKGDNNKVLISNLSFVPTYMHYEWSAIEQANGDLLARKNAMIYLLGSAAEPLSRSLLNTTITEEKQYITNILGSEVSVN